MATQASIQQGTGNPQPAPPGTTNQCTTRIIASFRWEGIHVYRVQSAGTTLKNRLAWIPARPSAGMAGIDLPRERYERDFEMINDDRVPFAGSGFEFGENFPAPVV